MGTQNEIHTGQHARTRTVWKRKECCLVAKGRYPAPSRKIKARAGKTAQRVKAIITQSDDLSWSPRTPRGGRRIVSLDFHMYAVLLMHAQSK